jgi:nucleolar protein 9
MEREWMSKPRAVPSSFAEKLCDIVKSLTDGLSDRDVRMLAMNNVASPVLQVLLVLHAEQTAVVDALIDRLLLGASTGATPTQELHAWADTLVKSQVGSHLMEKVTQVASPRMFSLVFDACFRGRLAALARHSISNYTVQSMMQHVKTAEQAQAVLEELLRDTKHLLLRGRSGVVLKMVDCAARFECRQQEVMQVMLEALGADKEETKLGFVNYLLRLQPANEYNSTAPINAVGVQIMQSLLHFTPTNNTPLLNSFLSQPRAETAEWTKHPSASRAFEAFLTEPHVSDKIKKKIMRNLEGEFVAMAKDKYAGHIVDKCWSIADIKQKVYFDLIFIVKSGSCFAFFIFTLNRNLLLRNWFVVSES